MKNKKILSLCFFILCGLIPCQSFCFDYFDKSIDYWDLKGSQKTSTAIGRPQLKTPHPTKDPHQRTEGFKNRENKKFDWTLYLNPKTTEDLKEVFREGNHTPPTPLLEVAKNPTDKNIKNWFEFIDRKNKFMARLNQKMSEYLEKTKDLKPSEKKLIKRQVENQRGKIAHQPVNPKRFYFRMYFESSCPHCQQMMGELTKLQNMGFYIELRQIDDNKSYARGLPFKVGKASKSELREKKIDAWPVLFIGDQEKKIIYRVNGFQKASDILMTLQNK